MGRPSKTKRLNVWMNGELAGNWSWSPSGRHVFEYEDAWLDSPFARPISLSMPLRKRDAPYTGSMVAAFFDNLVPDSPEIRKRLQSRFGTDSTDAFDLLAEIGSDCVGALQLLPPESRPDDLHSIKGEPLDEASVADMLRATVAEPVLGQREPEDFRISLAGFQEKTALLRHEGRWHRPRGSTPTTHIFKLPMGKVGRYQPDMSASVENEWLCGRIARAYGLETANSEMGRFEEQRALIVERFDRRLPENNGWWLRLPQEDLCQALGIPLGLKYESEGAPGMTEILSFLLYSEAAQADRRAFFKTQVLFWMLCATDGHARNFSVFIGRGGSYTLTPLYDILSAYPILGHGRNKLPPEKAKMAMAVRGRNRHYEWDRMMRGHWMETARSCGLESEAEGIISELIENTARVVDIVAAALPADFPSSVAEPILLGLKKSALRMKRADSP